jgi:hypothetical protein
MVVPRRLPPGHARRVLEMVRKVRPRRAGPWFLATGSPAVRGPRDDQPVVAYPLPEDEGPVPSAADTRAVVVALAGGELLVEDARATRS